MSGLLGTIGKIVGGLATVAGTTFVAGVDVVCDAGAKLGPATCTAVKGVLDVASGVVEDAANRSKR